MLAWAGGTNPGAPGATGDGATNIVLAFAASSGTAPAGGLYGVGPGRLGVGSVGVYGVGPGRLGAPAAGRRLAGPVAAAAYATIDGSSTVA